MRKAAIIAGIAVAATVAAGSSLAKEQTRRSPFSSSTYRIWKEPRGAQKPRSVDRVIRRNPPAGAHSEKLEQQGSHFTSDGKAPYIQPPRKTRPR